MTADLVTIEVIGTQEPVAVPTEFLHSIAHVVDSFVHAFSLCGLAEMTAEGSIVAARDDEQTGNHQAFCLRAFTVVLCGLEALVRIPGEAVEVQAVVPVSTSNERQPMRAKVIKHMVERDGEMFEERLL